MNITLPWISPSFPLIHVQSVYILQRLFDTVDLSTRPVVVYHVLVTPPFLRGYSFPSVIACVREEEWPETMHGDDRPEAQKQLL